MTRPAFADWLIQQDQRNDPVGDLARDFDRDLMDGCASRALTAHAMREHLEYVHNASSPALDALDAAEAEWSAP